MMFMNNMFISRRNFIRQSALLVPGALLAVDPFANPRPSKYKMGLQLFSIRGPLAKDVVGTIKQVSAIGYEDSETYGYDPVQRTYYGMKAADFKKLLADNKLITTSGHYDFTKYFDKPDAEMMKYVDQCIEGADALGQKYITWPWLDPKFRTKENYKLLVSKLNAIGERINKAKLGFAYHNHDFEFADLGGENAYDMIMRETDPKLVKLQMDLYWVMHSSKLTPAELIAKQPGRFVMWHIKDMDKKNRDYSELGNGSIDFTVILPESERAGLQYYYIEQGGNFATDPMKSVTDSAIYFRKHLEQYLK